MQDRVPTLTERLRCTCEEAGLLAWYVARYWPGDADEPALTGYSVLHATTHSSFCSRRTAPSSRVKALSVGKVSWSEIGQRIIFQNFSCFDCTISNTDI